MPKPFIYWLNIFNQPSKEMLRELASHPEEDSLVPPTTIDKSPEAQERKSAYDNFNDYNHPDWNHDWREQDGLPPPAEPAHEEAEHNARKVLELFSVYSDSRSSPLEGSVRRLFSGRWNTHFAKDVRLAIDKLEKSFHSVEYILACIKIETKNKPYNPNGDFANILKVIKMKTNVDYSKINAIEVYQKFHPDVYLPTTGKPVEYWMSQYDHSTYKQNPAEGDVRAELSSNNAWKSLELLAEYAGFYKHSPVGKFPHAWGGQINRFFSGRWNTSHGNDIQKAIGRYYEMDSVEANDASYLTTTKVLGYVKQTLGDKPINPTGDLAKVLEVIKIKTGVDYFKLETPAVEQRDSLRA